MNSPTKKSLSSYLCAGINFLDKLCDSNKKTTIVWFAVIMATIVFDALVKKHSNNFEIFRGVPRHSLQQINLYSFYPAEYIDKNHYGILFSFIIAPFYHFPNALGKFLFNTVLTLGFYYSIRLLPLSSRQINAILLLLW